MFIIFLCRITFCTENAIPLYIDFLNIKYKTK